MKRKEMFLDIAIVSFCSLVGCVPLAGNDEPSQVKITASVPVDNDRFGSSVSMSGDYAICGAPGDSTVPGLAYIYRMTGANAWDSGAQIIAPISRENGDEFGRSVGISGDYAIVGAPFDSSSQGSAYIFHRTGINAWGEGIQLVDGTRINDDNFGLSVAISGDYAIVCTPLKDRSGIDRGIARIFHRNPLDSTWDTGTELSAEFPINYDFFGWSVAISGDYAMVGAICGDGSGPGKAFIFHRTGTNAWAECYQFIGESNSDCFGFSVSISGEYAIIGARYNDNGGNSRGAAYIYHRTGLPNTWGLVKKFTVSDAADLDYYGYSAAIDGNYAYVSSPFHNTTGNICVFYKDQGGADNWGEISERIVGFDSATNDVFGCSISLSDNFIIAGAKNEDGAGTNRGAAYISKR